MFSTWCCQWERRWINDTISMQRCFGVSLTCGGLSTAQQCWCKPGYNNLAVSTECFGLSLAGHRGLALRWAKVILWSKTILASQEAGSREEIVNFAIHIAFEEAALGSHETFIASRATLTRWRGANLVSVETVIGSGRACLGLRGACLVLRKAVLGSQGTSVVSTETCFQEVAKNALATLTFLCLCTCRGLVLPSKRSCSNFSRSKWMTRISAVCLTSHCDTWFSTVEKQFPSWVSILFSINL